MKENIIIQITAIIVLSITGAFIFQSLIFPWMLSNPYFEKFEFIKSYKEGKIVINPKEQVYIQENTALQSAAERAEKSVVAVRLKTESAVLLGSGFIVATDGLILTVADLAQPRAEITVFFGQEQFVPQIVKRDLKNNLALLKIEKTGLATAGFSDPEKIKLGQRVFSIAKNAAISETAVNEGIIRSLDDDSITTNIAESLYFRGGPLFDIEGKLVGISKVDSLGRVSSVSIQTIKIFTGF